ncbi:MAG TPA: zinc ribbon domain-containing protein [Pyrinomonadaceae bacterium]|jgi:tetratricopeptide (TPR) repeat protein
MWTFDPDKYQKQVLVPATEEFKKSGVLPDVFERYALPLDVSDLNDIQQATGTVFAFWNKNIEHPKLGNMLRVLRTENKESVQQLVDAAAREALRELTRGERKKKQEKRFDNLDKAVKMLSAKGYLSPEEKNTLITKFTAMGLTEQEVLSRVNVPIQERVVKPPEQGLDPSTRKTIRSNLATLNKTNLYEFLEIRRGISTSELEKRYQELSAEWAKRKNDNKKISAMALLGIIKTTLLKEGGLEKYEKALVWDVIDDELSIQVEFAATDGRISRSEFDSLVDEGIKVGLSKEQATEAILWLAHKKGAVVEFSERRDTIICAKCYANVPKENNKCTSCGEDLWTICPKCTKKLALSSTACGNCGYVTADRYRVNLLARKFQFALDEKRLEDALTIAREAERIWGRADDVAIILNKVELLIKQAESYRKDYDEALTQKRLLAARDSLRMLVGLSPHYKSWDGKTPEELQRELELQFQKVEKLIEKGRQCESEKNVDEAIRIYQEVLNIAVDFEEVQKRLKKYPPEPVHSVTTTVYEGGIVIKWGESPSAGNLEYVVVRYENRAPVAASDGEVIAKIPSNSLSDENVRPGSFVYYGVCAERGGAYSPCVASDGVLAIKEVEDFYLEVGDAVVRGSWKFDIAEGKVRVLCGNESSLREGAGSEIQLTSPHAFTHSNLTNGETYAYRVFVEYQDPNGKTISTTGKFASATPTLLPQAIERFDIRSENGELNFQWTPPPFGTVSIYRLSQKPEWECGALISLAKLAKIGTPLRNKSEGAAVDASVPNGQVYYTLFTIYGDIVVVGQTKEFIPAEEITGLRVEDFGSYLLLRWKWSGSFQAVTVAWRHDHYPVDVQDKQATKQTLTKYEYDAQGGLRILNPKKLPYKFTVFTVTERNGKLIHSAGLNKDCSAEIRTLPVVKISYSVKAKGWWRKSFVVSLTSEESISDLPELLVVAKHGETQPLDRDSGQVVARIKDAAINPSLPFEYEFEISNLRRPFFVRLFFAAPNAYDTYKLSDPPPKQLKVK